MATSITSQAIQAGPNLSYINNSHSYLDEEWVTDEEDGEYEEEVREEEFLKPAPAENEETAPLQWPPSASVEDGVDQELPLRTGAPVEDEPVLQEVETKDARAAPAKSMGEVDVFTVTTGSSVLPSPPWLATEKRLRKGWLPGYFVPYISMSERLAPARRAWNLRRDDVEHHVRATIAARYFGGVTP
jgi:hypothetical protein